MTLRIQLLAAAMVVSIAAQTSADPLYCAVAVSADKTNVCVGETVNISIASSTCSNGATVGFATNYSTSFLTAGVYTVSNSCSACGEQESSGFLNIYVGQLNGLTPSNTTMCPGSYMLFTADAAPTNVPCGPMWSLSPTNAGTLSPNGPTVTFTLSPAYTSGTATVFASCGTVTNSATITVATNETFAISTQPVSQVTCPYSNVTFSVAATGNNLSFQWLWNGIILTNGGHISGVTNSTLTISNVFSTTSISNSVPADNGAGSSFGRVVGGELYTYQATGCATVGWLTVDPDGNTYTNGDCTGLFAGLTPAGRSDDCPGLALYSLVNKTGCAQLGTRGQFQWPGTRGTDLNLVLNANIHTNNTGLWEASVSHTVEGVYDCIISSDCGSQISTGATLYVSTPCDGIPDWWRLEYFGTTNINSTNCATCDPTGNGFTNLQDYQDGNDPTNYYDNMVPGLSIVSGNGQTWLTNQFLPQALVVLVTSTNGAALTNAPVTFSVTQGTGLLASSTNATTASSLTVLTGSNGDAAAYFLLPRTFDTTNQITVSATSDAGVTQVVFVAQTYSFALDTDGDGMPDWWEIQNGLNPYSGISLGGTNFSLVGWWTLNETNGTTVGDSSTSGANGTAYNIDPVASHIAGAAYDVDPAQDYIPKILAGAIQLNGTNAYVQIPYATSFTSIDGYCTNCHFTVSFWLYRDDEQDTHTTEYFMSMGDAYGKTFWISEDASHELTVSISNNGQIGNSGHESDATYTLLPLRGGLWHHVAVTYRFVTDTNSILQVYLDGLAVTNNTLAHGPLYPAGKSGVPGAGITLGGRYKRGRISSRDGWTTCGITRRRCRRIRSLQSTIGPVIRTETG